MSLRDRQVVPTTYTSSLPLAMHNARGKLLEGAPANRKVRSRAGEGVEIHPLSLLSTEEVHCAPSEPFSQLAGSLAGMLTAARMQRKAPWSCVSTCSVGNYLSTNQSRAVACLSPQCQLSQPRCGLCRVSQAPALGANLLQEGLLLGEVKLHSFPQED